MLTVSSEQVELG
jgi:activator of HSP90 ATPase